MHNRILIGLVYIIVFFTGAAGLINQVIDNVGGNRAFGVDSAVENTMYFVLNDTWKGKTGLNCNILS